MECDVSLAKCELILQLRRLMQILHDVRKPIPRAARQELVYRHSTHGSTFNRQAQLEYFGKFVGGKVGDEGAPIGQSPNHALGL